jgi:23S rRNA-/tRNA-specific pseudouridylate synthase
MTSIEDATVPLSNRLQEAYASRETDGILEVVTELLNDDEEKRPSTSQLIDACKEAAQGSTGQTISMLNACIAACVQIEDAAIGAEAALDLLEQVEATMKDLRLDMMTYALAYSAIQRQDESLATDTLDKAIRLSKKTSGSSRRKSLAAARRRPTATASDSLEELQYFLGKDFAILAETDDLVVVNKPVGVVCNHRHVTTAGKLRPGKQALDASLVDAMVHCNVPLSTVNPQAQGLVHRLDRGTSGCIVLAKSDRMHALLATEFFLRRVQKTYHAAVAPVPRQDEGLLDLPVDNRPARSRFRVLQKRGESLALIVMETFTGRKHQVRVHAAEGLQAPILLDETYGKMEMIPKDVQLLLEGENVDKAKFFLHAATLKIPNYDVAVSASKPFFWRPVLDLLE